MNLLTTRARAHVNYGRWIAICTRCANAERLTAKQVTLHCTNCQQLAEIDWPADADDIWRVLEMRPVPETRHWYPAGHELAVRSNTPHGQTVKDLMDENLAHGVG